MFRSINNILPNIFYNHNEEVQKRCLTNIIQRLEYTKEYKIHHHDKSVMNKIQEMFVDYQIEHYYEILKEDPHISEEENLKRKSILEAFQSFNQKLKNTFGDNILGNRIQMIEKKDRHICIYNCQETDLLQNSTKKLNTKFNIKKNSTQKNQCGRYIFLAWPPKNGRRDATYRIKNGP